MSNFTEEQREEIKSLILDEIKSSLQLFVEVTDRSDYSLLNIEVFLGDVLVSKATEYISKS